MNCKKPSAGFTATQSPTAQSPRKSPAGLLREAPCASSLKSIAFGAMRGTLTRFCDGTRWAAPLAVSVLLLWVLAGAFADYLDLPEVHISHRTRECVRVVSADGSPGSCGALPDRYEQVWVK